MSRAATARLLRRPLVAAAANGQLADIPFVATGASGARHGPSVPPREDATETPSRIPAPTNSLGTASPGNTGVSGARWALRAFSVSAPATVADTPPKASTSTTITSTSSSEGATAPVGEAEGHVRDVPSVSELDALFRCRPAPLGTGPNPAVAVSRAPGLGGALLAALGYYGKESRLIMGARVLYGHISRRADDEAFLGGQWMLLAGVTVSCTRAGLPFVDAPIELTGQRQYRTWIPSSVCWEDTGRRCRGSFQA